MTRMIDRLDASRRPMVDSFGRRITYVRLSVTDRCDLRCRYCMAERMTFMPRRDLLRYEEMLALAHVLIERGVRRIRLTGGEPLVRRDVMWLIDRLGERIGSGLDELTLTTNGTQLVKQAQALRDAGVDRLNVSLDSLRGECVQQITGSDSLEKVLNGLQAAKQAGFTRIKINMVPMIGVNDIDLDAMVTFCMDNDFVLRLIEAMPMGHTGRETQGLSLTDLTWELQQKYGLIPSDVKLGGGPARYWTSPDSGFTLGLITPMSQHFCAACNRVRLAVDGTLYMCLGQEQSFELRPLLRAGCTDDELEAAIREAIELKPERHEFLEKPEQSIRFMSMTGG